MRLIEVVASSSEKVSDENLTDADFADSALHAAQVQESTNSDSLTPVDMQAFSSSPAAPRRNSNNVSNVLSNNPGFEQGYPGSLDDSWLSHGAMTAPGRQPVSDLEAVQKTICLATEMNCDPVVMLELNRMKTEVTNPPTRRLL
ncbi:unnamed protein product [Peronospora farinosa]|uniref:Uncharacterized protein n=1 Tax=Peronospora farinosa TaxID=134698 RepID=A0AAV0TCX1_9STRA|nr:unnamed protein product [Peronospora farinosa]